MAISSDATLNKSSANVNNPSYAHRVARGGAIVMLGLVGGAGFQYLYNLGLAHFFGAQQTGDFLFVLSMLSIMAIIGQFGVQELLLRYVAAYRSAEEPEKLRGVLVVGLCIGFAGNSLLAMLLYSSAGAIANWSNKPEVAELIRRMIWFVPALGIIIMSASSLQGALKMDRVVLVREIGRPMAILAALAIAWLFSLSFGYFTVIASLSSALIALGGIILLWSEFSDAIQAKFSHFSFSQWITFALSVMLLDIFRSTSGWLDTIILGFFASSAEVAVYFAAVRTALLITIVLSGFNAILSPMSAQLWQQGNIEELDKVFKLTTRWTCTLVVPVAIFMLLSRNELMSIFGEEYVSSGSVLLVVIIGRTFNGLTGGVGRLLMMTGYQKIEMLNSLLTIMLMLTGMIWGAMSMGMLGVAIASSSIIVIMNIIKLLEVWHFIGIQPYDSNYIKLIISVVCTYILGLIILSFTSNLTVLSQLLILGSVITISYFSILFALGITEDDYMMVDILNKIVNRTL